MSRQSADLIAAPDPADNVNPATTGVTWRRVAAIARNAFREAVRDRVLYNLVVFVLLLIAAAILLGEISAGQEAKIIVDLGLSAILLFGVFIAIFVGVGLVYKEIERRTLYAILSKPIVDLRLFAGRNFAMGTIAMSVAYGLFFGSIVLLPLWLQTQMGYTATDAGWVLAPVGVLAILLTPLVGKNLQKVDPRVFATGSFAIFALVLFMRSHFNTSADLKTLANSMGSAPTRWVFAGLYYSLPNLTNYNAITAAAPGQVPDVCALLVAAGYGVIYVGVLLAATALVFSRRNLK